MLSCYRVFLNFSQTALDLSVVEAMACGLPVLSTNQCVADILPGHLKEELIMPCDDTEAHGGRMCDLLSASERDRSRVGWRLRELALRDHGIDALVDRILREMVGHG